MILNQKFGLGNQLFQYAAGLYFARKYGATLEIVREDLNTAESYGHSRPCLLDRFNISAPIRERTFLDRALRSGSPWVVKLTQPARKICRSYSIDPLFTNHGIHGDYFQTLPVPLSARFVYLSGLYHAYQYARVMEPELRDELTFRYPPSGRNLETLQCIQDTEFAVSLHIRRGDFHIEGKGQNLLPEIYYQNAVTAIYKVVADPTFFVFSDDIAFAREHWRHLKSAVFVDNNGEDAAQEDLRLISACRHHILANSTFSWWGAWLNSNQDKVVIAPCPWYVTEPRSDLIPPSWKRIPSQRAMTVADWN